MVCANPSDRLGRGGGIVRDGVLVFRRTGAEHRGRPAPNLITADEIAKSSVQNALEAVQKLRPAMLKRPTVVSTNGQSKGDLVVYVDNTRYGTGAVENLRQIPAPTSAAVRYFSASESQLKQGSNLPGGVIEVLTKRQARLRRNSAP